MSGVSQVSPKITETVETRPLGVLVRAKSRSFISEFPYSVDSSNPGASLPESRQTEFSPTGDVFASVEGDDSSVIVRSAVDGSVIVSCGGLNDPDTPLKINFATFSPRGTYLLTWARPMNDVNVPNLVVYHTMSGKRLGAFYQKTFHVDFWPSLQWSDDETIVARSVTNTVHFFHANELDKAPYAKLGIPGIVKFALSHGSSPYSIAAFIAAAKGGPAKIGIYQHPDEGGELLSSRSTFRADFVKFMWNSRGVAVLALVSTNIDATGENYYGESSVYYMNSDGTIEKKIDLPKKGPIHDVAWSSTGAEFVVVYGNMPSRTTMFDDKCEFKFDFGTGPRNTLSFSPHGRFVALAGFGNLAGAVEFWDKNKCTLVGRADLPCTTMFSWSPCSRYFLAATTFPRLRVDNGIRITRFDGKLIHQHKYDNEPLFQAAFRPALRGTYSDPKFTMEDMIGGPPELAIGTVENGTHEKKSEVYRPPGSRGAAPSFKLNQHVQAGAVDKTQFMANAASVSSGVKQDFAGPSGQNAKRFVPGMDPELMNTGPSKASLARKKKKERQAAKISHGTSIKAESSDHGNGASIEVAFGNLESLEAAEKAAKKLKKKLRTIQSLKADRDEGKELNEDQLNKLALETNVTEELALVEKKIDSFRCS